MKKACHMVPTRTRIFLTRPTHFSFSLSQTIRPTSVLTVWLLYLQILLTVWLIIIAYYLHPISIEGSLLTPNSRRVSSSCFLVKTTLILEDIICRFVRKVVGLSLPCKFQSSLGHLLGILWVLFYFGPLSFL